MPALLRLPPVLRRGATVLCLAIALIAVIAGSAVPGRTQDAADPGEPFAAWERTAEAAAAFLDRPVRPVTVLEQLRTTISDQREEMLEISRTESVEARTLRAQLEALGPPPAEGESEPTELSERRADLADRLAEALAPMRTAREAYERANVLISEITTVIRGESTRALLARSPSPLGADAWRETGIEVASFVDAIRTDIERAMSDPERSARFLASLPLVAVLTIAGLATVFVGEPWATRRAEAAAAAAATPGRRRFMALLGFVARLVLPLLGAAALLLVPRLADLEIDPARALRAALPDMVLFLIGAHVLGRAIFSRPIADGSGAASLASRAAYLLGLGLGVFLAIEVALDAIQQDFRFSGRPRAVLAAPLIAAGSVLLFAFGGVLTRLVRRRTAHTATDGGETDTAGSAWVILARLLQASAILSAIFLLLGYFNLAREALVPVMLTLALLGLALWLFELMSGFGATLSAGPEPADDETRTLLPVLLAVLIGVAALPPLALIWGASPGDIAEIWRLMTDGVPIGEMRISLSVILILVITFTLGVIVTRWLQRVLRLTVLPRTRLDIGARSALVTGVGYAGLTLSALVAVSTAGIDLSSLAFVAGALSIGIGFGLQNIVQNFVSGVILLIERPIKEGDWIEVSGHAGIVRKISVRSTRIETFDRHDVIVPNGDLVSGTVRNMTLSSQIGRVIVPVGVAYGSDIEATRSILLRAAELHDMVLPEPEPIVLFMGLGESSLDFELRCFIRDISKTVQTRSDLTYAIYLELEKAEIEIPFPQRVVHLRNGPSTAARQTDVDDGSIGET